MTSFHNVSDIGQRNVISSLEDNMKSFLDWSFLNIGGFINVNIPTSGFLGGNFHQMKTVVDPAKPVNKVWETSRKEWVYESGVVHNNSSPIRISGIYLNNTFLPAPTGSGNYTYRMNYPLGRVTFDNPVSSNSNVSLNYSYRYVQVYKANESVWWKELQTETYNSANFKTDPDLSITSNHRIQLPAIIIETTPRTVLTPYELGTSENIIQQDLLLHVFTENPVHRNSIIDTLLLQKDKVLYLYNINKVIKNNVNSLNFSGEPNPNRLNYDKLSTNPLYILKKCNIKQASLSELNAFSHSLYNGVVRWTIEIFP